MIPDAVYYGIFGLIWFLIGYYYGKKAPPMSKGTMNRTVRVEDELWEEAKAVAKLNGETVADVIRRALKDYIEAK